MSNINMDAIKERLSKLQKSDRTKNVIWKPEGKHTIRIVPYKFDTSNPFIELYFHYGINNKSYLSPMSYGEADPFVEFADKLKRTGDTDSWKQARKFQPKLRTYVPIVVRGKEDEGVKFWGFGKTVDEELLGYISDPDYGDITDPRGGRDIKIEYTKATSDESWPKTKVRIGASPTPLTKDKDIFNKLTDDQPDIYTVYEKVDYDTLDSVLQKWIDPNSEEEETPKDEIASKSTSTDTDDDLPFTPDKPVKTKSPADEAADDFEDLFES